LICARTSGFTSNATGRWNEGRPVETVDIVMEFLRKERMLGGPGAERWVAAGKAARFELAMSHRDMRHL
jgi:hypothetical protein